MADELAKDHKTVWLQPLCCVDERAWCSTDPGPCEDCGMPSIKYERAPASGEAAPTLPELRDKAEALTRGMNVNPDDPIDGPGANEIERL